MRSILAATGICLAMAPVVSPCAAEPQAGDEPLQEVVVTAGLWQQPLQEVPASVAVLDKEALQAAGQQHFEDVLSLVPNLNWAGDTSRPRYFQIRGIGELEQYQGAPNPSVGLLIDDIDFSGLGMAATLFDLDHVEVLRGPQGTRYGANALGGLIYIQSAAPEPTFGARAEVGAGNYGALTYGASLTGPVAALDSSFRLAAQRYTSDGYYHNAYLGKSTDRYQELTLRGRWRYEPAPSLRIDLTLLAVRINNGYDAFAIDNSRTTQSDQPGEDDQHSTGGALRIEYRGLGSTLLTLIGTAANTSIRYGFDSDWGNPVLWAPYTYQYSETQQRERHTRSLEARLQSTNAHGLRWLIGLYGLELTEDLTDTAPGLYVDPFDATQDASALTVTTSHYRSRNGALFGLIEGEVGSRWHWSGGLRIERRAADYRDVTTDFGVEDVPPHAFAPIDHLWGGDASLEYALRDTSRIYLTVARGYKAGGFNLGLGLPADQILFGPESDLNVELGYKAELAERRLRLDADVFYTHRSSLQLKSGEQLDPSDPTTFLLYTSNARSGRNYGLESSLTWRLASLELGGSVGVLNTVYHGLTLNGVALPDRALPNAPSWQGALSATWRAPAGIFLRLDATGTGSFYYDVPALDPYSSSAYGLLNAKLGIERSTWSATLWASNLTDKRYTVRGFYFGLVPPDFNPTQYVQLGPPRQFGVRFTCSLR
jgi:outer membrane receptor protein involved in Fe transport